MSTIAEAVERLYSRLLLTAYVEIVSEATDGLDGELASVEAFGAVTHLLHTLLDTYDNDESERGRMIYALTVNATGWGGIVPLLGALTGDGGRVTDLAFTTFAHTVELLVSLHEGEAR